MPLATPAHPDPHYDGGPRYLIRPVLTADRRHTQRHTTIADARAVARSLRSRGYPVMVIDLECGVAVDDWGWLTGASGATLLAARLPTEILSSARSVI